MQNTVGSGHDVAPRVAHRSATSVSDDPCPQRWRHEVPGDESALDPLRQWPQDVDHERWTSERQLFGDPDLGMSGADRGKAQYAKGIDAMVSGDSAAAGKAFQEAASLGHPGAWREIGIAVFHKLQPQLRIASRKLFERGAEGGDARCLCYLGLFCRTQKNSSGALVHYRAADAMGDAEGSRELGILLDRTGDTDGARAALERSRDRGSASGALALGAFLSSSASDIDRAEEAFRKATEMGHPKGPLLLADLLEEQRGNAAEAQHFRRIALEKAREHRALMESLEGPDYMARTERRVAESEKGLQATPSSGAASGSSCMVFVMAVVTFVLCVARAVSVLQNAEEGTSRRPGRRR